MKQYIGDGVYIDFKRGMLELSTSDGTTTTNTIYLEPGVWAALVEYVKDLGKKEE